MKLASILNPDMVVCKVAGATREEIYGNMIDHVMKHITPGLGRDEILNEMTEREDSIKIPYEGIALPHIRNSVFGDLFIAIGTLENPVKLKECDFRESGIIIMSFISQSMSDTYLKALAAFTKYLIKPDNQAKLLEATDGEQLIDMINADNVELKSEITAEDVMKTNFTSVKQDSSLSEALDIFTRDRLEQIPVVDDLGKLLGIIDATEIIRRHVPEYILMMDNLKFLTSFEPFDKIFKEEQTLCVKDFMQQPKAVISTRTPLIQLTVSLVKKEAPNLYVVTDENDKLVGVISIQQLIHKVLRG